MMETIEIPNQNIQGLIKMAIKEQLPWLTLASVLDELTPTIAISKQVIKILLKELETIQTKLKEHQDEDDSITEVDSVTQNEESKIQFPDEDKVDCTNDVIEIDQADETFENGAEDSERLEKENSNEAIKKLMERGEKLYTYIGDNNDIFDENKGAQEIIFAKSEKDHHKFEKTKKSTTEKHQKTKHICNSCAKEFRNKAWLTRHERIHTGIKPFQCKLCNKSFAVKSNLTKHQSIHSNEKPFQCKTCKKCFTLKQNLLTHEIRIHTDEKPFQCTSCPKGFVSRIYLKRHEVIHTGEVPFQCKICSKRFKHKASLTFHEKIHAKRKEFQ